MELVITEASAQAVRAFRGASGTAYIRGGSRALELNMLAALTFYLDIDVTVRATGRLARAVNDATSLEQANQALTRLGVATELDLEREVATKQDGESTRARPHRWSRTRDE